MKQPKGEILYPNIGIEIMDPEQQYQATYKMVDLQKQRWGNRKIGIYLLDHSAEDVFLRQKPIYDNIFGKKYATSLLGQNKQVSQRGIRRVTSPESMIIEDAQVAYILDNVVHSGASMGGGVFFVYLHDGDFDMLELGTVRDERNLSHYCIVRVLSPGQYEYGIKQFFDEEAPDVKAVIERLSEKKGVNLFSKIPPFSKEREDLYHVHSPTAFQTIMNAAIDVKKMGATDMDAAQMLRKFNLYVQKVGKQALILSRGHSATIFDLDDTPEIRTAGNVLAATLESDGTMVYHDRREREQRDKGVIRLTKHLYEERVLILVTDVLDIETHEALRRLPESITEETRGIYLAVLNYKGGEPDLIPYYTKDGKPSKTKNGLSNTVQAARSASR